MGMTSKLSQAPHYIYFYVATPTPTPGGCVAPSDCLLYTALLELSVFIYKGRSDIIILILMFQFNLIQFIYSNQIIHVMMTFKKIDI